MVMGVGAALAAGAVLARRARRGGYGSLTSANDKVDEVELRPDASPDEVVDVGVLHTFPASDPPAVEEAFETAFEREQRLKRQGAGPGGKQAEPAPAPRSPDWLLHR
jgi:hypothetical protein